MLITTWIIVSLLMGLGFGSAMATKDKKITAFTIFLSFVGCQLAYLVHRN
jgi:hypothetical protein